MDYGLRPTAFTSMVSPLLADATPSQRTVRIVALPGQFSTTHGGTGMPRRIQVRSRPRLRSRLLRIVRIATSRIHHCGKRTTRRMRQSGSALRKLIRSVAEAWFWSGVANGHRQVLTSNRCDRRPPKLLGQTSNEARILNGSASCGQAF